MTPRRLQFEPLESRCLLSATTVVSSTVTGPTQPADTGANYAAWDDVLPAATLSADVATAGISGERFNGGSPADTTHFFDQYAGDESLGQWALQLGPGMAANSLVSADYGEGSPQEALAELAYLDGSPTSTQVIGSGQVYVNGAWTTKDFGTVGQWASLRASAPLAKDDGLNFLRIDHAASFGVNMIEVGNEMDGNWFTDHHTSPHNPATYASYVSVLTAQGSLIDPSLTVGIDESGTGSAWLEGTVGDAVKDSAKVSQLFLSDHIYGTLNFDGLYSSYETEAESVDGGVSIAQRVTEFNSNATTPAPLTAAQAVWVDEALIAIGNSGFQGADIWELGGNMVNGQAYSLIENGAGGGTKGTLTPSYFAEEMFSKIDQAGGQLVASSASGVTALAVKEANGHLDVMLVNSGAATTDVVSLSGFAAGTITEYQTTGSAPAQSAGSLTPSLPANSVTVLDIAPSGSVVATPPATTLSIAGSGVTNTYTEKGSAVAVDAGLKVTSTAADLTGAKLTITDYEAGDLLIFNNQNGITGSYAGGVLTLSGTATPAQYQAALESVTFSTTSTNTTARTLSVVADDGTLASNTLAESVKVGAPVAVTPPAHYWHHHWG